MFLHASFRLDTWFRLHAWFRRLSPIVLAGLGLIAAAPASAPAEVLDAADNGFTIRESVTVPSTPDKAYGALIDIAQWWSPDHTYSRNAANLSIDARPMGCWCEKLPNGGGVRHMTVVYAAPGKAIRFEGGLGPLQAMGVAGSMTWELTAADQATTVEARYSGGGYRPGGFRELAPLLDGVLKAQVERYKRFVETGNPATEKP